MDQDFILKIKDCLNPNNEIRKKSEYYIQNLKKFNLSNLLNQLFLIITDNSNNIDINIKNFCGLLYKNVLNEENNWIELPFLFKNKVREDLYDIIEKSNDENEIKYLCIITANIAYKECIKKDEKMLKYIIKKIENNIKDNNIKNIISYLFIMKTFFEKFEDQKLITIDVINGLQKVIIPIIKNFKENLSGNLNLEERKFELALDNYSLILPFLKFSFTLETDYIFKPIIDSLNKLNPDKILYLKNIMVINDTINYYHRYIVNHIKTIINLLFDIFDKFIKSKNEINNNNIINNNDELIENINLCYLDILCLICDKEIEDKTSLTSFLINNANKYISTLLSLLKIYPQFVLDNESWNISKAICYILSFIINSTTDETILTNLLSYSSKYFNSVSSTEKINSLVILSCCLESRNIKILNDNIQPAILDIIEKLSNKNKNYSYALSWILGKISETIPSVFTKDNFYKLIPTLINIINNKSDNDTIKYSNEIRINICIVFGNLIKFYGDEETKNYNNVFNSYYKLFINNFIESSCLEENIISGLSFYLLRIIMNVIQFSSNDLQDHLEIIFSNLLNKFDNISNILKNNKSIINKEQMEKLYKIQEHLCLAINQIFNKIIRKININLCAKLYSSIINSFLIRNAVPYESGMLCLLNLVILLFNDENVNNMKNNLDIQSFYQLVYAIFANDDKDNENIKFIAILCIINLVKINSITLKDNIVEIYELIKTVAINREDISNKLKNLIFKATSEIEMNQIYKDKRNKK